MNPPAQAPQFAAVFEQLRDTMRKHEGTLSVSVDTDRRYCLEAPVGPATVQAWGGKAKSTTIPVVWLHIGKAYVSFHLMALYGDAKLEVEIPIELRRRMQGKTCFNFRAPDPVLFAKLDALTTRGLARMKAAGYIR